MSRAWLLGTCGRVEPVPYLANRPHFHRPANDTSDFSIQLRLNDWTLVAVRTGPSCEASTLRAGIRVSLFDTDDPPQPIRRSSLSAAQRRPLAPETSLSPPLLPPLLWLFSDMR